MERTERIQWEQVVNFQDFQEQVTIAASRVEFWVEQASHAATYMIISGMARGRQEILLPILCRARKQGLALSLPMAILKFGPCGDWNAQ